MSEDTAPTRPEVVAASPLVCFVVQLNRHIRERERQVPYRLELLAVFAGMCGGIAESDVLDEVDVAGGGQLPGNHAGEDELPIPSVDLFSGEQLECAGPVGRSGGGAPRCPPKLLRRQFTLPAGYVESVFVPGSPPGGPTPDVRNLAESIRQIGVCSVIRRNEVAPGDREDAIIVAVAIQQFGAIREEARLRDDVVFQDDPVLHVLKEPGDGGADTCSAPEVRRLEERGNIIGPVDIGYQLPALLHELIFTGHLGPWPIDRNEDSRWSDLP
ncbi:MAG: hypothetical protein GKS03_13825 [Alphaproteobacteria bacterium]|nr:hypothetical protein [Alphaproteobacteria bacterium]